MKSIIELFFKNILPGILIAVISKLIFKFVSNRKIPKLAHKSNLIYFTTKGKTPLDNETVAIQQYIIRNFGKSAAKSIRIYIPEVIDDHNINVSYEDVAHITKTDEGTVITTERMNPDHEMTIAIKDSTRYGVIRDISIVHDSGKSELLESYQFKDSYSHQKVITFYENYLSDPFQIIFTLAALFSLSLFLALTFSDVMLLIQKDEARTTKEVEKSTDKN